MKVIDKFVLKAYVGPVILTFFIMMFILLMHFLWLHLEDLVGKGLSTGVILELIMYASATLIPMALPLATLLASIMTLGNLGENNELLAMKAAGISLPKIARSLLVLTGIIALGSFFVINNLTPFSYKKIDSLWKDISKQRQELKFRDGIFFNGIPDMSIRVGHQDSQTGRLDDVLIFNNSKPYQIQTTVADSGYIRIADDRKYLLVTLFNGQVYEENRDYYWYTANELSHHLFSKQEMTLPLSGFSFERTDGESTRSEAQNMGQLSLTIDSLRHAQDSMSRAFNHRLTTAMIMRNLRPLLRSVDSLPPLRRVAVLGALDTLTIEQRNQVFGTAATWAEDAKNSTEYEGQYISYTSNLLYRAQIGLQQKVSLPFSILIFFMIGAALGAIIRKGGLGMPIVVSVLFFVFYYIISITGEKFVKDGALHPFVGMWISSFILLPIAIFLIYKSTNDSAIFNVDSYKQRWKKLVLLIQRYTEHGNKRFE